jgi:hypothetical protein
MSTLGDATDVLHSKQWWVGIGFHGENKINLDQAERTQDILLWWPIWATESDRIFIKKHKNNKNIQRDKIKFTATTIEIDGLKFPRATVRYDDIKDTPWLSLDNNVYQKNGYDYFTFDAVKQLSKVGKRIPTKDQRQKAADVFGGDYWLLGELFNYPKNGLHLSSGDTDLVDDVVTLWSSTPYDDYCIYSVYFNANNGGNINWSYRRNACSLVFLQE